MKVSDFDYALPPGLIAQTPLRDRAASRLMHVSLPSGDVQHRLFQEVEEILQPNDVLVFNDTRVTARRLVGTKPTGAAVELLLLHELSTNLFQCLAKPGRRLQVGAVIEFPGGLVAEVKGVQDGFRLVSFVSPDDWRQALEQVGQVPLPPYISESLADPERYQTVYASAPGSAAAPTAGLHFTQGLIDRLKEKGVKTASVTLDVSLDTFRPMSTTDTSEHVMHGELCRISDQAAQLINNATGRIIGVGTTSVRTLESFATGPRKVATGEKTTKIFIQPGYKFQIVDGMFTNFHMPRTTMMLMISALANREIILKAYDSAVREQYRFLSFGDSMLIL